jgi:hypothetical protein
VLSVRQLGGSPQALNRPCVIESPWRALQFCANLPNYFDVLLAVWLMRGGQGSANFPQSNGKEREHDQHYGYPGYEPFGRNL